MKTVLIFVVIFVVFAIGGEMICGFNLIQDNILNMTHFVTPFIALVSALIIYCSFNAQTQYNKQQYKLQRYETELNFIYYRLADIQKYRETKENVAHLENIRHMVHTVQFKDFFDKKNAYDDTQIQTIENDNKNEFLFLIRYLDTFIVSFKKLESLINPDNETRHIDDIQRDYIFNSLVFEFNTSILEKLNKEYVRNFDTNIKDPDFLKKSLLVTIKDKLKSINCIISEIETNIGLKT